MSRAHLARLMIGLCGGTVALVLLLFTHPFALAVALALPVFVLASFGADRVFRRFASREEIRADLEDRVRNPP